MTFSIDHTLRHVIAILIVTTSGIVTPINGQDDSPFGETAETATEPAAPIDLSQYGPAVRAVMEAKRTTPVELLQGILLLVDLGEPDLAKPLFARLTGSDLDDAGKAALARKFGSHRMMRLARATQLGPDAAPFADACMVAFVAEVRDPKRMAKLATELADPAPEVRNAAIVDLVEAGQRGAAFCVESLVVAAIGGEPSAKTDGLRAALVEFGPLAVEPLLAASSVTNPAAKTEVIKTLGIVAPQQATPYLVAPALIGHDESVQKAAADVLQQTNGRMPTPAEAVTVLAKSVDAFLAGRLPVAPDEDGMVEVWTWTVAPGDAAGGGGERLVARKVTQKDASVIAASRLAGDLAKLAPQNATYQTIAVLCRLQTAKIAAGLDVPLPDLAKQASSGVNAAALDQVLAEALRRDLVPAALAAVELLGDRSDVVAIYGHAPSNTPLVEALGHGDRRLRFAALGTVIQLEPLQPFPGASRVTETLDHFLRGAQRRALIAMPDLQRAQTIAGWIAAAGFDPIPVGTGRQTVVAALEVGDVELALVDAEISRPGVREVLYQLRNSPSIGRAAIGIVAGPRSFEHAEQIAAGDRWTATFARPQDADATNQIVEKLMALAGRSRVSADVRAKQAAAALDWTGELLAGPQSFYDLRRLETAVLAALFTPELAGRAAVALGHFGTADSQRALVDLASRPNAPIDVRQKAAAAFRQSVAKHGIQLTRSELLRQYERYNASEHADRETQEVLSYLLDTIERKGGTEK